MRGKKICMLKALLTVLLLVCFAGCAGEDIREQESSNQDKVHATAIPENTEEPEDEAVMEEGDAFNFGHADVSEEEETTYVYDREQIEIPFYMESHRVSKHDVGLLVFIDGILQEYSIKEEVDRKEDTMQLFSLNTTEEQKFTILVKPNKGKKGEKAGIYVCSIVYPSFQPESEKKPSYQYYGKLGQVSPVQLKYKKTVPHDTISFLKTEDGKEISQEIINAIEMFSVKSVEETLEDSVYVELYQKSVDETVMKAEDGKIRLHMQLYGGVEGTYRTTVFVNNHPVQIDGKDAVESKLHANKMSELDFELDLNGYGEMNTIYAVTVPAGDAYLDVLQSCEKSDSRLLVNK